MKGLTSYDLIKMAFVGHKKAGTVGYHVGLNKAVELLVKLEDNLVDKDDARKAMNADQDVMVALTFRKGLKDADLL